METKYANELVPGMTIRYNGEDAGTVVSVRIDSQWARVITNTGSNILCRPLSTFEVL